MVSLTHFHFMAVLALTRMFHGVDAEKCQIDYSSIFGKMLKGHTFRTLKTVSSIECWQACEHDSRCKSLNYVIVQGICELNNSTKERSLENFVTDVHRYYLSRGKF